MYRVIGFSRLWAPADDNKGGAGGAGGADDKNKGDNAGGDAYTAPATKADLDKLIGDAVGAEAAKYKAPEKYKLELPKEGAPFAETDLEYFGEEAKAMGLTQAQAQAMLQSRVDSVKQTANTLLEQVKADKELGGKNFDETTRLAQVGRDLLFPPDSEGAAFIRSWFDRTGFGNHPELIRAFVRLGKMNAEDTGAGGGQGGGGSKRSGELKDRWYGKK